MQMFRSGVPEQQTVAARSDKERSSMLRAAAVTLLVLSSCVPQGMAQQTGGVVGAGQAHNDKAASDLPAAPAPVETKPLDLRPSSRDFSKPFGPMLGNPINRYRATSIGKASFANSVRLGNLVKDNTIYLSLSDAIALALENNYDIAIARYDLDIADTDILRTKSGAAPLGAPSGLVTGTLGGSASTLTASGGPGGTSVGSGGAGSGVNGLTLTTGGAGPLPEQFDPTVTGTIQLERSRTDQFSSLQPSSSANTDSYNFAYNQGFATGTALQVGWDNSRSTTTNFFNSFSPQLTSTFKATVTQHLLQGAGIWINRRFIYEAQNDRRITNSAFRQQILYTVNQVETIYWGLVQAYEDVQAKQHAVDQSTKVDSDTRKQLEIGTMAPLDVVNADATVATDKQGLISAQSSLNYQEQIIKQAIARNLSDGAIATAHVVPTDRITTEALPEETQTPDQLVQVAFANRPELEQAALTLRNDEITLRGARNGLLPTLDVYGFYGASAVGGAPSPYCLNIFNNPPTPCAGFPAVSYPSTLSNLVNSSAPDKGIGFTFNLPIRNREAQSVQERSLMEYRQAELRLAQLYTQIRMQVVNAQFALANDRAQVDAAIAGRNFAQQSLDSEQKKLNLGASTAANVLLQDRALAAADNNLINARATFAKDRAGLYQTLATTLEHYGINLQDAATGNVGNVPVIPGLQPASQEDAAPGSSAPPAPQAPSN